MGASRRIWWDWGGGGGRREVKLEGAGRWAELRRGELERGEGELDAWFGFSLPGFFLGAFGGIGRRAAHARLAMAWPHGLASVRCRRPAATADPDGHEPTPP